MVCLHSFSAHIPGCSCLADPPSCGTFGGDLWCFAVGKNSTLMYTTNSCTEKKSHHKTGCPGKIGWGHEQKRWVGHDRCFHSNVIAWDCYLPNKYQISKLLVLRSLPASVASTAARRLNVQLSAVFSSPNADNQVLWYIMVYYELHLCNIWYAVL